MGRRGAGWGWGVVPLPEWGRGDNYDGGGTTSLYRELADPRTHRKKNS